MTYMEIYLKESKLVNLGSPPQNGLHMLVFDCWFPCDDHDHRLEYGVTSYILRLIEKYTSITLMIAC